jgi:3-hydroxyisobutyrate dehydrogenase-like beta-hydroxyacid dehydrogenase
VTVPADAPAFGFIGFGALAASFAAGLRDAGVRDITAFTRTPSSSVATQALETRLAESGVHRRSSVEDLVVDRDVVIAAVPAEAAEAIAGQAVDFIQPRSLYVDPAPLAPSRKALLADMVATASADYADVAVLGTVAVEGHRVPMLAAGPGAARWVQLVGPLGFRVTELEGPSGRASMVKLLRSVYMKGRDALVLEMVLAAHRHGLEQAVLQTIGGPAEQVPFPELVDRVLRSVAVYADRRSAELRACAELVEQAGVQPMVTTAGAERLRWLADLDVRASFCGQRPDGMQAVLDAIDALDPVVAVPSDGAATVT